MQSLSSRLAALLFGLIALLGLAAALNLAAAIGQPFGGFYAAYSHSTHTWRVEASTPPWWPVIVQGQLRYDDELLTLNGQPYRDISYQQLAALPAGAGFTLAIRRNAQIGEVQLPARIFTLGNYLDIKLPDLLNGLGFWLLAVAVFRARADQPINRVFALACGSVAGSIWLTITGLFVEAPGLTRALNLLWVPTAAFVGVLFIHLAALFPEPIQHPVIRQLRLFYAVMAGVALLYLADFLLRWQAGSPVWGGALTKFCTSAVIGSMGLGVAFYLARLAYLLLRRTTARRVRRQAAFMLCGILLATPYVIVILLRALIGGPQTYFAAGLDFRYLTLAVPLTFAFVILRYQTRQRVPRSTAAVFILATSALLASLITWMMRRLEPAWINTLNWSPFVPLFFATLLSAIFYSLQSSWRSTFGRIFQWERRSYTAVRRFSQQVISQTDLRQLPTTIAEALVNKMELERATVWLWQGSEQAYRLAGRSGAWPTPPPDCLKVGQREAANLPHNLTRPLHLTPDAETGPAWLDPVRRIGTVEVVAPLVASGEPIGLLGLGKRWDEEFFDDRDIEIIELVAQQAALFILTAEQIEQLRQVPHQITTAQERERFRIAQELHDTVQQFLGRLPFYLQVSQKNARANPAETESILQRCIGDVESAAQAVRQIRNSLAPLQLESSLSQPLQTLIENFRARAGIETLIDFAPEADAQLALDARHALYRVVQQALDNVAAHANATQVNISLQLQNSRLLFLIADNGRGATDAERRQAETSGSFGLISMRARITALGGEFNFDSAPETGTQISGWLPVK